MRRRRMSICLLWASGVLSGVAVSWSVVADGAPPTIVLHAEEGLEAPCEADPCGGDSVETRMELGHPYSILVFVNGVDSLGGIVTAFEWPPDWVLSYAFFCQPCLCENLPVGPGPIEGLLAMGFDCVIGGESTPVARIVLTPTSAGCMRVIPSLNYEVSVFTCDSERIGLEESALGTVCAGSSGIDVCNGLKRSYQR
jgi:hypothetical protein